MPTIVQITVSTSGTPSVQAIPDTVHIPSGVHGVIQWQITNPPAEKWKFHAHGIDILNAGTEFDHPAGGGTRVFTWNNNHTRADSFKYIVRVQNDSGASAEADPFIVND